MNRLIELDQPPEGTVWVWIHHAPPRGSRTAWTLKGDVGDPYLLKLMGRYKPNAVYSGHVHNAPFYAQGAWSERIGETWVFNPGMQPGAVPAHVEFDFEQQTAQYNSLEGIASLDLAQ